jgi:hypothetical protein
MEKRKKKMRIKITMAKMKREMIIKIINGEDEKEKEGSKPSMDK